MFVENSKICKFSLHSSDNLRELINRLMQTTGESLRDKAFIVGNKVYDVNNSDNKIFSNHKTMFIVSKALPY